MAATTAILDCANQGVMDLINNDEALQIWELIRAQSKSITTQEIHDETGVTLKRIQQSINQLLEHGLLLKIRPRKPHNTSGYAATANQIVIVFDEHDTRITDLLMAHSERVHSQHQEIVRRHQDPSFQPESGVRFRHSSKHCFTQEEFAELRRRVHAVIAFLNMPRNQSQKPSNAIDSNTTEVRYCNQSISIQLDPLVGNLLPSPTIITTSRSKLHLWDDSKATAVGFDSLTPREREIAIGIAEGLSRGQIADQLGISKNTVSTLLTRAYKKIGVSSQTELATRLAGQTGPLSDDG